MRMRGPGGAGAAAALLRQGARLVGDETAGTMMTFALLLPVLVAAAGAAIDYSFAASTRSKMQAIADASALASVREMQLARSDSSKITAIANNVINSAMPDVSATVSVDFQQMTVHVDIDKQYVPVIRIMSSGTTLHVGATAKMNGSMPLCLLGLDPSAPHTVGLEQNALLTAPGCLVQSNSKSKVGLQSKDNATMTAGMICSAGGKVQSHNANYSPAPTTDCPVLTDPLSSRPAPAVGGCDYNNKVVDGLTVTLPPGVYCGGWC